MIFLSIKRSTVGSFIKIKKITMIIKTSTWTHFIRDHLKKKLGEGEKGGKVREKEVLLAVVSSSGALGEALGMAAVPVCV